MAFDFKALGSGTYGLVLGEHRDLTPEQSVATYTLDYISDDNVLFVSVLDMRGLGAHGYVEVEFQRRERRTMRDGSDGWLPETLIRVRLRGSEVEFSGPSFRYTLGDGRRTWYRLTDQLAWDAARMLSEPAEADLLPDPAALGREVAAVTDAMAAERAALNAINDAIVACAECGHLHFYTTGGVYIRCPLASEGCRCIGQTESPEQAALDYAETLAAGEPGGEGFA